MPIPRPRTAGERLDAARVLLAAGTNRPFWLSRGSELLGQWVFLIALMVMVYRVSGDIAIVAALLLARLIPRAVVLAFGERHTARLSLRSLAGLDLLRAGLVATLVFVSSQRDLVWAAGVVAALGFASAVVDSARVALLPRVVSPLRLGAANALNARIERISFVVSPLLAAGVLWIWDVDVAILVHAGALTLSALMLGAASSQIPDDAPAWNGPRLAKPAAGAPGDGRRPEITVLAAALFTGAAVAIGLKISLVALVDEVFGRSDASLGLLLAAVGFGTIAGPVPIPRVLGRFPASLAVAGCTWALALILAVVARTDSLMIAAVLLVVVGFISITNDALAATATRRLTPESQLVDTTRMLVVAVAAGQVVATLAVVVLTRVWEITMVVTAIGIVGALVVSWLLVTRDGKAIAEGVRGMPGAGRLARR